MDAKEKRAKEMKHLIHWALINQRKSITVNDKRDSDGNVDMQAMHCPYYVALEEDWGMDWGTIMHPASQKFGQVVFEHEWCGCSIHLRDIYPELDDDL